MRWFLLTCIVVFYKGDVLSQIRINEVCSSNREVLLDDLGESSDWIEIYNYSDETVELSQFGLSDSEDKSHQLSPYSLLPNEYVILFASDRPGDFHLPFRLNKSGEEIYLYKQDRIESELQLPPLRTDQSYGWQDGEGYQLYDIPTPGVRNGHDGRPYIPAPDIKNLSGIYSRPSDVVIRAEDDLTVHYTTDGSEVTTQSRLYEEPFELDHHAVVRARSFDALGNPSETSHMVFIDNVFHQLPVVHVTVEPDLLYDPEEGMLVLGHDASAEFPYYGANFWKEIEVPSVFTWMEFGRKIYSYELAMEVHGGRSSRTNPIQSLRFTAKGSQGDGRIVGQFFPNDTLRSFEKLVLRNASGDFNHFHGRDAFLSEYLHTENLHVEVLRARPVVVYLNDDYYGLMYLREKFDEDYLLDRRGVPKSQVDIIEKDSLALHGTLERYKRDEAFLLTEDMTDSSHYASAQRRFDLDNMIDYFICQTVINNLDWPRNNIKSWSSTTVDTLWRHFLFDMDVGLGRFGWTEIEENYLNEYIDTLSRAPFYRMWSSLMRNDTFKKRLAIRYQDLLNTTFASSKWSEWMKREIHYIRDEVERHMNIWSDVGLSMWEGERDEVLDFVERRADLSFRYLQDYIGASGAENVRLDVLPKGAGTIKVNTVDIEHFPWQGQYYPDYETRLEAHPMDGWTFNHWENEVTGETITHRVIQVVSGQEAEWTAHFSGGRPQLSASLYPTPTEQFITLVCRIPQNGPVHIKWFNSQGMEIYRREFSFVYAGKKEWTWNVRDMAPGVFWVEVTSGEYSIVLRGLKL